MAREWRPGFGVWLHLYDKGGGRKNLTEDGHLPPQVRHNQKHQNALDPSLRWDDTKSPYLPLAWLESF